MTNSNDGSREHKRQCGGGGASFSRENWKYGTSVKLVRQMNTSPNFLNMIFNCRVRWRAHSTNSPRMTVLNNADSQSWRMTSCCLSIFKRYKVNENPPYAFSLWHNCLVLVRFPFGPLRLHNVASAVRLGTQRSTRSSISFNFRSTCVDVRNSMRNIPSELKR